MTNKVHEKCDGIYFGVDKNSDIIDRQIWKIGTHHGFVMFNGHVSSTVRGDQRYSTKIVEPGSEPGCGKVRMTMEADDEGLDAVRFKFNSTESRVFIDGEFSTFYVLVALYYPGQEVRLSWI